MPVSLKNRKPGSIQSPRYPAPDTLVPNCPFYSFLRVTVHSLIEQELKDLND
jgi:hypothetical protein